MFNIHTSGGKKMMKHTKDAAEKMARKLKIQPPVILGVTVLTSMNESDLRDLGIKKFVKDQVLTLAKLAKDAGLDGIVASAQEVRRIKQLCGQDFVVVCPGIRPTDAKADDQERTMTAKEAIKEGADYIVVGRPITQARNPLKAAEKIVKEMRK